MAGCTLTLPWAQGFTYSVSPLVRAASCSWLACVAPVRIPCTADIGCHCACISLRQCKHPLYTAVSMQTMAPTSTLVSNSSAQMEVRRHSGWAACCSLLGLHSLTCRACCPCALLWDLQFVTARLPASPACSSVGVMPAGAMLSNNSAGFHVCRHKTLAVCACPAGYPPAHAQACQQCHCPSGCSQ